jgi:hypothetical protein
MRLSSSFAFAPGPLDICEHDLQRSEFEGRMTLAISISAVPLDWVVLPQNLQTIGLL